MNDAWESGTLKPLIEWFWRWERGGMNTDCKKKVHNFEQDMIMFLDLRDTGIACNVNHALSMH